MARGHGFSKGVGVYLLVMFGGCGRVEKSPQDAEAGAKSFTVADGGTSSGGTSAAAGSAMGGQGTGSLRTGGSGGSGMFPDAGSPLAGDEFRVVVSGSGGTWTEFGGCNEFYFELDWDEATCLVPVPDLEGHIDLDRVNIQYVIDRGATLLIRRSPVEPCTRGWRFSSAVEVELCSATCAALASAPEGTLEMFFGCSLVPVPPE